MKITRANVAEYAKDKGLEPIQIDGIPEGFSFIAPDLQIANVLHSGQFFAFIPNYEWDKGIIQKDNLFELMEQFFYSIKIRDNAK